MVPISVQGEPKEALNQRLETIGWGLLLITIGALWLAPQGTVPEGTWLIVVGVIMLGVNGVRYRKGIKLNGTSLLLGGLAVIFGVGAFVGLDLPFVSVMLIAFGIGIILRPWLDSLLERKSI
ncbi:MAG: hypothetical protein WCJ55_15020 [Chloroflexales bacterium]